MPDSQIFRGAVSDVPAVYELPSGVAFILKAVNASFDGSGAAGAFLPCVTILSDSGHVIARAVDQAVSVDAGSDAEVSWFPHVKNAAAGVTPSGSGLTWAASLGTFAASNGPNASVDCLQTGVATNDATYFTLVADSVRVLKAGMYLVHCLVAGSSTTIAATTQYIMSTSFDTPTTDDSSLRIGGEPGKQAEVYGSLGARNWFMDQTFLLNLPTTAVPMLIFNRITTFTAAGASLAGVSNIGVVRLSDAIAGNID